MGQRHCRELSIPLLARKMHRGKDRYHLLGILILPFLNTRSIQHPNCSAVYRRQIQLHGDVSMGAGRGR